MQPRIIARKGNKFVIDEDKILPYMRSKKDLVLVAVSLVCKKLKDNPETYSSDPAERLQEMNDQVYSILQEWKVYKG